MKVSDTFSFHLLTFASVLEEQALFLALPRIKGQIDT